MENERLLPEGNRKSGKETIIFFDALGFGWVLDNRMVKEMKLNHLKGDSPISKSLIKILENLLESTVV